ncbi:hypothetical protein ACIOHS_35600 [Streptomyces sp. NPDC088253]|uniref:hypothetical protein n=1 Tax=Streptomyces sp. NPDC088253 TaxID=3365846 RepID=UPI0038277184
MHERPLPVQVSTAAAVSGDIDTEPPLQRSLRQALPRPIGGPPTAVTGIPASTTERTGRMG